MCPNLEGVVRLIPKKDLKAPELRKKWCKCCDEFGTMVTEEVKTNPRYMGIRNYWNEPPPPTPE